MVVRYLDIKKDPFRLKEDDELVFGPKVPYLSIGALLYLAQCTRPNITFSVNLLVRYIFAPTIRHWKGIKDVLRYLRGTTDMGLFYSVKSTNDQILVGYTDVGFLSDSYKACSQNGHVFSNGDTAISWRSTKQILVATSSNHSEIIVLHEVSRECSWLRSMIHHIRNSCSLPLKIDNLIVIHEDNATVLPK
ncbi:secreted RxLR effector protein 161-like [Pyrus communis]|uniref:secreted RxLR effector protein 161-like n=1 Tax=Pyrus communis TaxID=23211 RepID=UPI0035BFE452